MSSGGFTGKGMFASMAYLVVEYDGGKQKQCNFKDERDVDKPCWRCWPKSSRRSIC